MTAEVSVLIPTVGRRDLLEQCIRSVLDCDPAPDEVLVVDQSGGDAVAAVTGAIGSPLVRRTACDGTGTARAMNVGLAAIRNETVLVTHDDCTVAPEWVGCGTRLASLHPDAIVTGRVLPPDGSPYVPSTKIDEEPHDYTGQVMTGVLYPANMVVRRSLIVAIGGFDERRSLLVAEDNDLCYRWLVDGRPFHYEPELVVWHHDWRTPEELVRTHIAYARAQGGFYAKHLHAGDRRVLPMLRWDLRRGVRTTVRGLLRREPRWQDAYREMTGSLLLGLAKGWREARALDRISSATPVARSG